MGVFKLYEWYQIAQSTTFERMVVSIKRCLKKILLSERIAFEEPQTILREIDLTSNN